MWAFPPFTTPAPKPPASSPRMSPGGSAQSRLGNASNKAVVKSGLNMRAIIVVISEAKAVGVHPSRYPAPPNDVNKTKDLTQRREDAKEDKESFPLCLPLRLRAFA